jgi:hypothetical protein
MKLVPRKFLRKLGGIFYNYLYEFKIDVIIKLSIAIIFVII